MSNTTLEKVKSILFLELRPWIFGSQQDLKFKQLLSEVKSVDYTFQPLYELVFDKPISNIRKWYCALIDAEMTIYMNQIQSSINESNIESEKKYHVHFALTRTLSQLLKEVNTVISDKGYTSDQYNIDNFKTLTNPLIADESFILHYLKHSVIRSYFEIQDANTELLKEAPLSFEEVYYTFFKENVPTQSIIIDVIPDVVPAIASKRIEPKQEIKFTPIQNDIRSPKKGIYQYSDVIKTPKRFAEFEEKLFLNGYIDEDYTFTNKHGYKNELAAIYHHAINKGYFNPRKFQPNKEIKPVDIRKFLDHRYDCSLDKQFRNLTQEAVTNFTDKHNWLYTLVLG